MSHRANTKVLANRRSTLRLDFGELHVLTPAFDVLDEVGLRRIRRRYPWIARHTGEELRGLFGFEHLFEPDIELIDDGTRRTRGHECCPPCPHVHVVALLLH